MSRRLWRCALVCLLVVVASGAAGRADDNASVESPQEYLAKLQQILPPDPPFDAWLQKTGALPPDFNSLPRHEQLPDPMTFLDGHTVKTAADWPARRAEIMKLFQKYAWGTFPARPTIGKVDVLDETHNPGYTVRNVKLEFGPDNKGTMRVRVYIPDGKGPFPVLINSSLQGWAPSLIRRGYISAGFAGNDAMDDAAALADVYPNNDFALLPRRGWAASLVVDYLYSLPQTDQKHIGIFGYSRDGKMAVIAAAFDTRITAVIAGSTGVGGVLPFRASSETGFGEGIETTTRSFPTWFAPQLRFFVGREDRLPVDGNLIAALIAPRSLLMEWGHNDQVSSTWGNEQTYYTALKVYKLLGAPNGEATFRLPGFHGANDEEADLDWLDQQFGRSKETWTNSLIFQWDWDNWRKISGDSVDLTKFPKHTNDEILKTSNGGTISTTADWEKKADDLRKSIEWMMGSEPAKLTAADSASPFALGRGGPAAGRGGRGAAPPQPVANPAQVTPDIPAWVIQTGGASFGWPEPQKSQTATRRIMIAGGIRGDLYYPVGTPPDKKLPTAIWLHGYSYPLGYMWVYHQTDLHPILALVQQGYAVLAFDQSGFGSRLTETGPFYDRYPHWSHMGRMVEDAQSAIDALEKDSMVDTSHIYLFGYSVGGTVALYTAALDPRVAGVISASGFTPMRTDTAATGTGGIARYAFVKDILPRLGFFVGHESQVPYDFDDVIAMIAPRPVYIVNPLNDRDNNSADVIKAVKEAGKVYSLYGASQKLQISSPWDYNRLTNAEQNAAIAWITSNGSGAVPVSSANAGLTSLQPHQ
jgi:pimeloyl-ACP methyl ester carboxylesterase